MEATWFVVADRSKAQLYEVKGSKLKPVLEEIEIIEHPEGRRAGDAATSSSQHELYVDSSGASEEEDRRFARQVVDRLRSAQQRRKFAKLLIAAPAHMVGKIRKYSNRTLTRSVHREIIGDYTGDSRHALQARLRRRDWLD